MGSVHMLRKAHTMSRTLTRPLARPLALAGLGALLDVGLQRWLFARDMRMSHTEAKRERKEMHGDPHLRGRLRDEGFAGEARRLAAGVPEHLAQRSAQWNLLHTCFDMIELGTKLGTPLAEVSTTYVSTSSWT